jgi:hypothetical protein
MGIFIASAAVNSLSIKVGCPVSGSMSSLSPGTINPEGAANAALKSAFLLVLILF